MTAEGRQRVKNHSRGCEIYREILEVYNTGRARIIDGIVVGKADAGEFIARLNASKAEDYIIGKLGEVGIRGALDSLWYLNFDLQGLAKELEAIEPLDLSALLCDDEEIA